MSAMEKKTGEKKNIFAPLMNYFKDVRGELRKVVWPTFKQVRKNTTVVLVVVVIVGLLIAGLDLAFHSFRNLLITNDANKTTTTSTQTQPGATTQQPIDVSPQQGDASAQQDAAVPQQDDAATQQTPAGEGSNQ